MTKAALLHLFAFSQTLRGWPLMWIMMMILTFSEQLSARRKSIRHSRIHQALLMLKTRNLFHDTNAAILNFTDKHKWNKVSCRGRPALFPLGCKNHLLNLYKAWTICNWLLPNISLSHNWTCVMNMLTPNFYQDKLWSGQGSCPVSTFRLLQLVLMIYRLIFLLEIIGQNYVIFVWRRHFDC